MGVYAIEGEVRPRCCRPRAHPTSHPTQRHPLTVRFDEDSGAFLAKGGDSAAEQEVSALFCRIAARRRGEPDPSAPGEAVTEGAAVAATELSALWTAADVDGMSGAEKVDFAVGVFLGEVMADPGLAADALLSAVEAGETEAFTALGVCHERGLSQLCGRSDTALAARWFERAAAAGDVQGAFNAGVCALRPPEDLERAARHFGAAALQGHAAACANIALMTAYGFGGGDAATRTAAEWLLPAVRERRPAALDAAEWLALEGVDGKGDAAVAALLAAEAPTQAETERWLEAAAVRGDGDSAAALAQRLLQSGDAKDEATAVRWFRAAADGGHPVAMSRLGAHLYTGRGCEQDRGRAAAWFQAAHDAGAGVSATVNLANCFARGHGVAKDRKHAIALLRQACELGDAHAEYSLAKLFEESASGGDAQLTIEAGRHLRLAAAQGHADACFEVVEAALEAEGREVQAAALLRTAADKGHAQAQFLLGQLYDQGVGCDVNTAEATRLWKLVSRAAHMCPLLCAPYAVQAAAQGVAGAMNGLAVQCASMGSPEGDAEALEWYRRASDLGHRNAQYNLAVM